MNRKHGNISAIVLARNEGQRIRHCLESVRWADEIIVVDNGSSDNTRDVAQQFGVFLIEEHMHDFSFLRMVGYKQAKGDWIFYVDADEEVTGNLQRELQTIVRNFRQESSPKGYYVKRKNYYLGHEWPTKDNMQRFFWRRSFLGWRGRVHETALIRGSFGTTQEYLLHRTHRTLAEMVFKTNEWSAIEAELRFKDHHPPVVWWRLVRVMATAFMDSFIQQGGWRAGVVGWIESIYQSFSMFITYAKLWELQQRKSDQSDR